MAAETKPQLLRRVADLIWEEHYGNRHDATVLRKLAEELDSDTPALPDERGTLIEGLRQAIFWLRCSSNKEAKAAAGSVEEAIALLSAPALPEERAIEHLRRLLLALVSRPDITRLFGFAEKKIYEDARQVANAALSTPTALPNKEAVERVARALARQAAPQMSANVTLWVDRNWRRFIPNSRAVLASIPSTEGGLREALVEAREYILSDRDVIVECATMPIGDESTLDEDAKVVVGAIDGLLLKIGAALGPASKPSDAGGGE